MYVLIPLVIQHLDHVLLQQTKADISVVNELGEFKRRASRAEMVLYVPGAALLPRT